ncbi:dynamin family protein [Anabaena sp. UHCC 0451]|uniref:dynamin family protein n=1 Tax=Anabaena sp. UHCC 0451 TaxID=2055235 RepID=UPI002B1E997B|nr:dynamin family protein [Anabaena sp. UHCC 0451]MEA5577832.1 dynamin family protein [Anabaena sp. UHCC 0451]
MNIDRNLLRQISAKTTTQQSSISSLVRGIHKIAELRDWVTIETVALPPIPVQRLGEWGIVSLLTVPKKTENEINGYTTPWAVVEWSLTTKEVVKKLDLRDIKANHPLWTKQIIINQPADISVNLTPQVKTIRENALFTSLENFCSILNRNKADFSALAKHYVGLLPKDVYQYYHDLIPESQEWLISDIAAISLEEKQPDQTSLEIATKEIQETQIKIPSDLTNKLSHWFKQCAELSNSLSTENQQLGENILNSLSTIDKRRLLPGFRLVFVGEFSRGKSYLINRLLNRNILPEGTLPTTATLTSIIAGLEEKMEIRLGGKIEIRPLSENSWQDLLATDEAGSDQEVFAGVRISLNHDWLRSLDIEIIDTPGAGDLSERRANLVSDILNQCDAAVLLVSATSPFSMTEAAFLEQEVIGRHVPRIMVIISKLDLINPDEREKLIDNICQKISLIAKNIPVIPTFPTDENQQSENNCLTAIIAQIESLVNQGERRVWRSRQVSQQLIDWLSQLIETSQSAISSIHLNIEQKKLYLRQSENEIDRANLTWDNLQLELEKRRLQRTKQIYQNLTANKEEIVENLQFELQKIPDLKLWWERDLPFRLRRELTILSRKSENFLLKFLGQDVEWLQNEVAKIFNTKIKQQSFNPSENRGMEFQLEHQNITDLQKYRLFTRVGSTAAMIAGSILGGPIGIAASTGILLVSEQYLNHELDTQRQILVEELNRVVDIAIDEYSQQVSQRLRQLYKKIIDDMQTEQAAWKFSKQAAFNIDLSINTNELNLQEIIRQSLILQQQITNALSM